MKQSKFFVMLCIAFSLLAGCSNTKVTSSWKAPGASATTASFNKIVVAALLPPKDQALQKNMESELVSDLRSKGVNAVSAFEMYGPRYFSTNENQALRKLRKSNVDGVLTIVLLDKNKERNYTPGRVDYTPMGSAFVPAGFYGHRFYGYYSTVYDRIYTPGYYTTDTNYFWETNLYDVRNDKLLYSAQSESFDPSSISTLANSYSDKIVADMAKQGVLAKK